MPVKLLIAALRAPLTVNLAVIDRLIKLLCALAPTSESKSIISIAASADTPDNSALKKALTALLSNTSIVLPQTLPKTVSLTQFDQEKATSVFGEAAAESLKLIISFIQNASQNTLQLDNVDTTTIPKSLNIEILKYLSSDSTIDFLQLIRHSWSLGGLATVVRTYAESSSDEESDETSKEDEPLITAVAFGYPGCEVPESLQPTVIKLFQDNNTVPIFIPSDVYSLMYSGYANSLLWPIMHRYSRCAVIDFKKLTDAEIEALFKKMGTKANTEENIKALFRSARTKKIANKDNDAEQDIEMASTLYIQYQLIQQSRHGEMLDLITNLGADSLDLQEEYADIFQIDTSKNDQYWKAYQEANQIFADQLFAKLENLSSKEIAEHVIWVNDYQIMLVPGMLRDKLKALSEQRLNELAKSRGVKVEELNASDTAVQQIKSIATIRIAYFHHIPFPMTSALRNIPKEHWVEIFTSLNQTDQIGFHVPSYVDNFGYAVDYYVPTQAEALKRKAISIPIGIDNKSFSDNTTDHDGFPFFHKFQEYSFEEYKIHDHDPEKFTKDEFEFLKNLYQWKTDESSGQKRILVGAVDRIDPSKGFLQRLDIIEKTLEQLMTTAEGLQILQNIRFVMIAPDSRAGITQYDKNREAFIERYKKINTHYKALFGNRDVITVFNKEASRRAIRAFYHVTDIHMATSFTDGFHLGPEEYMMSLIKHNKETADPILAMGLEEYKHHLESETTLPKKTAIGICVMSKNIGIAQTEFGKYALTYQPDDFGDSSSTAGNAGAEQLMKAIRLINHPEHAEALHDDPKITMTALQRTQAMQLVALVNDMTRWAERNIFGESIIKLTDSFLIALRKLIGPGIQYLAEGENQPTADVNSSSESPDSNNTSDSPTLQRKSPTSILTTPQEKKRIQKLTLSAQSAKIDLELLASLLNGVQNKEISLSDLINLLNTAHEQKIDFSQIIEEFKKIIETACIQRTPVTLKMMKSPSESNLQHPGSSHPNFAKFFTLPSKHNGSSSSVPSESKKDTRSSSVPPPAPGKTLVE